MAARKLTKQEKYLVAKITARLGDAELATAEAKNEIVESFGQGYEQGLKWALHLIIGD